MKKALLILVMAFLYAYPAMAQNDSIKTSKGELLFLTKELGFSTQIVLSGIFNSSNGPFELSYKKLKSGKWIRYGLKLEANQIVYTDYYYYYTNHDHERQYLNFVPSIGVEKRKKLAPNWNLFYGADAMLYASIIIDQWKPNPTFTEPYHYLGTEKYYSAGLGTRPFVGISYSISPRLYVATEASGNISTIFGKRFSERYQPDGLVLKTERTIWNADLSLRPASAIFVYYRF
jgi:hypothetical protein